jgi:selenium metabolism protein YedF
MIHTIDARGLACPQPVVLTLRAMAEHARILTIVDNQAAVENVRRLAQSRGYAVTATPGEAGTRIELVRAGAVSEAAAGEQVVVGAGPGGAAGALVVFADSDAIGRGADELGERLMAAFFRTLLEVRPQPDTVILLNSGVRLACQGSRALDDLGTLAERGVEILVCGTCLGYYELGERRAVGRVSNMYEIAERLLAAGRVVKL